MSGASTVNPDLRVPEEGRTVSIQVQLDALVKLQLDAQRALLKLETPGSFMGNMSCVSTVRHNAREIVQRGKAILSLCAEIEDGMRRGTRPLAEDFDSWLRDQQQGE